MTLFQYGLKIEARKKLDPSWDEFIYQGRNCFYVLHTLYNEGLAIQYQLEQGWSTSRDYQMLYYEELDFICN